MRMVERMLSMALSKWREVAEEMRGYAYLMSGTLNRMWNRLLSRAWEQWQWVYADAKRQEMLLLRGLMSLVHAKLAAAMYSWRLQAAESKRLAFLMAGTINRFRDRRLSRAWEQWQWVADVLRRLRFAMNGAINRLRNRMLSRAFEQWQWVAEEFREQSFLINGVLNRLRNRPLSRAFEKWQWVAAEARRQAMLLRQAVMRMVERMLSMALNTWRPWAADMRQQAWLMAGVLNRIRNRPLSKAWEKWQWVYAEAKRQAMLMAGAINQMRNLLLSHAWEQWQCVQEEYKRNIMSLRRGLMRMVLAKLGGALYTWRLQAAEAKRVAYIISGALARMANRLLSRAFEQWQWVAEESKRLSWLMSGAIRRMLDVWISRAWVQWQWVHADLKRQRQLMAGVLNRMQNRMLSHAWEQWEWVHAEANRQAFVMAGAINRMKDLLLSRAWEQWQWAADSTLIMGEAVLRWQQYAVSSALNRWYDYAELCRRMQQSVARGILCSRQKSLLSGLAEWRQGADLTRQYTNLALRALQRWSEEELNKAFNTWCMTYRWSLADERSAKLALQHWLGLSLNQALNIWRSNMNQSEDPMVLAMCHWAHQKLCIAVYKWKCHVWALSEGAYAIKQALCRWTSRSTTMCLQTWREDAARALYMNSMLWAVMHLAGAKTALLHFRRMAALNKVADNALHKAVAYRDTQLKTGAINQMFSEYQDYYARMLLAHRACEHWATQWELKACDVMQDNEQELALSETNMRQAIIHWSSSNLVNVLNCWFVYATESALQDRLQKKAILSLVYRMLSKALHVWRLAAANHAALMRDMTLALDEWNMREMSVVFATMREAALRAKHARFAYAQMRDQQLSNVVVHWSLVVASQVRNAESMLRDGANHWLSQAMIRSLFGWRMYIESGNILDDLMWRAIQRWYHRNINASFVAWTAKGSFLNQDRTLLAKAAHSWVMRYMGGCLLLWRNMAQTIRTAETQALYYYTSNLKMSTLMAWKASVNTMAISKHLLAFAMNNWEIAQARHVMMLLAHMMREQALAINNELTAAKHWKCMQMSKAIDNFERAVVELSQHRSAMAEAYEHYRLAVLRKTLLEWHDYVQGCQIYKAELRASISRHARFVRMRAAVQKLQEVRADRRRKHSGNRRACAHWLYSCRWVALITWQDTARAKKRYLAKARKMELKARAKAIEQWNLSQLANAMDKWDEFRAAANYAYRFMREANECYKLRTQLESLTQWSNATDNILYVFGLQQRGAMFWQNRSIAESFVTMQQNQVDTLYSREADKVAIVHCAFAYMVYGLRMWQWKAQLLHEESLAVKRAGVFGAHHWAMHMYALTIEHLYKQAQLEKLTKNMSQQAQRHHMLGVFQYWTEIAAVWREKKEDYQESVVHWAWIRLTAAADHWRWYAWSKSSGGRAMAISVSNWQGANVFVALSIWREWAQYLTDEEKSEEYGMSIGVNHWRTRSMLQVILYLRRSNDSRISSSHQMLNAEQVWRSRIMDEVFVRWRDYTDFLIILMELMAQASFRFYHKSLSDVFQHWRSRETGQRSRRSTAEQFASPNEDILFPISQFDPLDQAFEQQYREATL